MEMMIIHVEFPVTERIMQLHLIVLGGVSRRTPILSLVMKMRLLIIQTLSMQRYALVEEVILAQGRIRFPVWSRTLYLINAIRISFNYRALEMKTL